MTDIQGEVVTLTRRFGWKHDWSLPLSKIRWRKADVVGVTEDFRAHRMQRQAETHVVRSTPSGTQISRCNNMQQLCLRDLVVLEPASLAELRNIFPVLYLWYVDAAGRPCSVLVLVLLESRGCEGLGAQIRTPDHIMCARVCPSMSFVGRIGDSRLTDWLCRTFRKNSSQQVLPASYADLIGTSTPFGRWCCCCASPV